MPGSADTFLWSENFDAVRGAVPVEIAPRIVIVGQFPAGRESYISPGTRTLDSLLKEYSDSQPAYETDVMRAIMRQSYQGTPTAPVEPIRVLADDAVVAETEDLDDGAATPVVQGSFLGIGPGAALNGRKVRIITTAVIASGHPAGADVAVNTIEIYPANPDLQPEIFRNVVINGLGLGTSARWNTRDIEAVINDPLAGSRIARWEYAATASGTFSPTVGTVTELTFSGGDDGTAADADWEAAIDLAVGRPFRWIVLANAPSEAVRGYFANAVKAAPYGMGFFNSMFGEGQSTFLTARDTYGNGPDEGKVMAFYGWANHPTVGNRAIPVMAPYLGRWSAKINAGGLGGHYAVGNQALGFSGIATGSELSREQQEAMAAANVNYVKNLEQGGIGVHGFWTLDSQLERIGDAAVRTFYNDVIRRLAVAMVELAQNRGNSVTTRALVTDLVRARLQPYISVGFVEYAAVDTFTYQQVLDRFSGISVPFYEQWAYVLASLRFVGTLGGVFLYLTNREIEGLAVLYQEAGAAAAAPAATEGGAA